MDDIDHSILEEDATIWANTPKGQNVKTKETLKKNRRKTGLHHGRKHYRKRNDDIFDETNTPPLYKFLSTRVGSGKHQRNENKLPVSDKWNEKTNLLEPSYHKLRMPKHFGKLSKSSHREKRSLWQTLQLHEAIQAAGNRIRMAYENLFNHVQSGRLQQ